jgi:glycosyltransferase involved in cell wall biosynthesis
MHLIDSLSAGGAERVAVNMVNTLNKTGVETYLCATRKEGPLKTFIEQKDRYLFLNRQSSVDIKALVKLVRFIRQHQITILHAHSSSFFIAVLAKIVTPSVKVVWHDHYGLSNQLAARKVFFIRIASLFFDAVFSVNNTLKEWALKTLFVKPDHIHFLANYADLGDDYQSDWKPDRLTTHTILCLANLRPQKDHLTLLEAFRNVKVAYPDASLYLVGKDVQDAYSESLKRKVEEWKLKDVFFMEEQTQVSTFLDQASIGVLSSVSEGLPMALLEYGLAGLPVISTEVGECGKVLDNGQAGWLIPSGNPEKLAKAMKEAFNNPTLSLNYATRFKGHILLQYSGERALKQLMTVYNTMV